MCHVDDTKISHMDESVAREVIELSELNFGKMKVIIGNEHVLLGMKITCHFDEGNFDIDMSPYLQQTIEEFGEEMVKASTPSRADLFLSTNLNRW